jgi:hypothetical protein
VPVFGINISPCIFCNLCLCPSPRDFDIVQLEVRMKY